MQKLIISLRIFVIYTVLLGLFYPLLMVGLSHMFFPDQANGSLITYNGKVIGSKLISQEFTQPKYFHSRFSAVQYNAMGSGGSDLAPSSKKLIEQTIKHIDQVRAKNGLYTHYGIPADMVLCSASGLDPHISEANAQLQVSRVAMYRGLTEEKVRKLMFASIDPVFIGIWGQEGVNVLRLNLLLDELESHKQ